MSLEDFLILHTIGEGSFGQVYKVLRKSDRKIYALKKVKLTKSATLKDKMKALNEVRILASINHPNIVSYKQAFFDEPSRSLCLVMEYAEGGDLRQQILERKKNGTNFPEEFVWSLLIQLLQALKVLHRSNIMHRDIKSANIFITKDGVFKLGDLNLSKIIKDKSRHTQTGTPYYASPEVWQDLPYDTKSDIWSLGCVIYEAIALDVPFLTKDINSLYSKILNCDYCALPFCYSGLNKIVHSMLLADPKSRPSATDILNEPSVKLRFGTEINKSINVSMLKTIDGSLTRINEKLPKANYSATERTSVKTKEHRKAVSKGFRIRRAIIKSKQFEMKNDDINFSRRNSEKCQGNLEKVENLLKEQQGVSKDVKSKGEPYKSKAYFSRKTIRRIIR